MSDEQKPKSFEAENDGRLSSEELERSANEAVEFLKDSQAKATLKDFLISTYKKFEAEKVDRVKSRVDHEHEVNSNSPRDFHTPGNIGPLLDEDLNMSDTERAMVRGISLTKKTLETTLENRVDEINRLLTGIGGFSSQLKSCFARSTVVFLEQDDPKYPERERLVFSINLPNYELKRPMGSNNDRPEPKRTTPGPSDAQATWDEAVNAVARVVETSGLRAKYVKNDRKYGRFVMTQELRSKNSLPDEYFSITLDYNTEERIAELCKSYNKIVNGYDAKIAKLQYAIHKYPAESTSRRYATLKTRLGNLIQERDYFIGTVPDPNQLDEGILFLIEVTTHKDYHVVKDRMQSLMTRFILQLSHIAVRDAESNIDLKHELHKLRRDEHQLESPTAHDNLEGVQEYTIDADQLVPLKKKTG